MSALKECACGREYDVAEWRALASIGLMVDGEDGFLELRNCACGSTLAVPMADLEAEDRLAFESTRDARVARLIECAEKATDLALRYVAEDRAAGADVQQDDRIFGATRQASEYVRAATRMRAMTFNSGDLVLVATMHEELAAAAE